MVDISPDSLQNNQKKKNPFKKILDDVKKFMKKDEEKDMKSIPLETPLKENKTEEKKPISAKEVKKNRRSAMVQQTENSKAKKVENTEKKESEKSREKKGRINEKKLPKKFRKGW